MPEDFAEEPRKPIQSWTGISLALIVVILIVIVGQYASSQKGALDLEEKRVTRCYMATKNGDMAVRYALQASDYPGNRNQLITLRTIVDSYSKGLPDGRLSLRIAVAKRVFGGLAQKHVVMRRGTPDRDIWQEILNSHFILRVRVSKYSEAVKRAELGPLELPALSLVYENSGDHPRAESLMQQSKQESTVRNMVLGTGVLGLILAVIAGIVFLVLGFADIKKLPVISAVDIRPNALAFSRYLLAFFCASFLLKFTALLHIKSDLMFPIAMLIIQLVALTQLDFAFIRNRFQPVGNLAAVIGTGIAGSCAALPVHVLAMVISRIIVRDLPESDSYIMYLTSGGFTTLMMIVVIILVGPFVEEVAFRGVLLDSLQEKMSFWPAAFVSSAAFSLLHGNFAFKFAPIFFFGLILCYLRRKTGSLASSYVAHMCNNAIVTGLFFIT